VSDLRLKQEDRSRRSGPFRTAFVCSVSTHSLHHSQDHPPPSYTAKRRAVISSSDATCAKNYFFPSPSNDSFPCLLSPPLLPPPPPNTPAKAPRPNHAVPGFSAATSVFTSWMRDLTCLPIDMSFEIVVVGVVVVDEVVELDC